MSLEQNVISDAQKAYLRKVKRKKAFITVMRWGILIAFIALWELAARMGWIDAFITSSPSRIATSISNLINEGVLFYHISVTLWETIAGFLFGTLLGTLIAIVLWWSNTVARIADPYLVVLNALPKIALGPVIIVWVGAGETAIIVITLLISIVVTVMSVLQGFMEISQEKILLLKTFGANKFQILQKVVLPASLPTIISALKLNVGMSWVGVIVGEFLISKAGLGYLIVYGGQVFKLDLVMAGVVILAVLAAGMYFGVAVLEKKLLKWRNHV